MNEQDLQLVLVRYGSDTGLISLAAQALLCHTVDSGDGGLEWPKNVPVVDFGEEDRFSGLLGQDPDGPEHNWDDVLQYVLVHRQELGLGDSSLTRSPLTRVVTFQVACLAEDAEDVKRSLFGERGRCWYYDHHCPLGPIQVAVRLPTAIEEFAARKSLDVDETGGKAEDLNRKESSCREQRGREDPRISR